MSRASAKDVCPAQRTAHRRINIRTICKYLKYISLGVQDNLAQYVDMPGVHAMSSPVDVPTAQASNKAHSCWTYRSMKNTSAIHTRIRRADSRRTTTPRPSRVSIYEDAEESTGSPAQRSYLSDQAGPQDSLLRGAKLGRVTGRSLPQSPSTPAHKKRLSASSGAECARVWTAHGRGKVHTRLPSNGAPAHHCVPVRENPRRRTIYIPSDDTSVLTIHPRWRNRDGSNALGSLDEQMNPRVGLAILDGSRGLRKECRKPLRTSSRRIVLQPTPCSRQELNDQHDKPGSGPGKENLPPGFYFHLKVSDWEKKDARDTAIKRSSTQITRKKVPNISPNAKSLQLEGSHHSIRPSARAASERVRQTNHRLRHALLLQRVTDGRSSDEQRDTNPTTGPPDSQHKPPLGKVLEASLRHSPFLVALYSLPREDISRPEMCDEERLENRESALLRLVNHFFTMSENRKLCLRSEGTHHEGKKRLLLYYQNESNLLLYRKVQASLHSGILRAPHAAHEGMSRLWEDLGLQRLFPNSWLDTYGSLRLTAAVEVAMSRDLRTIVLPSYAIDNTRAKRNFRKTLTDFILSCLLRNPTEEDPGRPGSVTLR